MNVAEGARRMKRAGKWITLIPPCALVLFLSISAVSDYIHHGYINGYLLANMFLVLLVIPVPGAALWLAGWIVEGFAKDTH